MLWYAHAMRVANRFLSNLGKEHWEGVKWIMRYLKGTSRMHLFFRRSSIYKGFLKQIWEI